MAGSTTRYVKSKILEPHFLHSVTECGVYAVGKAANARRPSTLGNGLARQPCEITREFIAAGLLISRALSNFIV